MTPCVAEPRRPGLRPYLGIGSLGAFPCSELVDTSGFDDWTPSPRCLPRSGVTTFGAREGQLRRWCYSFTTPSSAACPARSRSRSPRREVAPSPAPESTPARTADQVPAPRSVSSDATTEPYSPATVEWIEEEQSRLRASRSSASEIGRLSCSEQPAL